MRTSDSHNYYAYLYTLLCITGYIKVFTCAIANASIGPSISIVNMDTLVGINRLTTAVCV